MLTLFSAYIYQSDFEQHQDFLLTLFLVGRCLYHSRAQHEQDLNPHRVGFPLINCLVPCLSYGNVKHELRAANSDIPVTTQIYELRVQFHDLQVQIHEFLVQIHSVHCPLGYHPAPAPAPQKHPLPFFRQASPPLNLQTVQTHLFRQFSPIY